MRHPAPLPPSLHGQIFTRRQALCAGVPEKRLRARDIERVACGIYRHVPGPQSLGGTGEPESTAALDVGLLTALCERAPEAWLSHTTAARLYGLPLPPRLAADPCLHVSGAFRSRTAAELGPVRQHGPVKCLTGEVVEHQGLRIASPERVLIDLMPLLQHDELVVLGDALVRQPRAVFESRSHPWSTRDQLWSCLSRHGHTRGIVPAREALGRVRVGADSPPETLLRLRLVEAGCPEPELQARLHPEDPFSPVTDLAYRRWRVAIQYEGAHHFSAEQQAGDEWRDGAFQRDGWHVARANRVDLREGFIHVVARIGALLIN
ncbi:hypothetical protein [Nesterenkonia suensis]